MKKSIIVIILCFVLMFISCVKVEDKSYNFNQVLGSSKEEINYISAKNYTTSVEIERIINKDEILSKLDISYKKYFESEKNYLNNTKIKLDLYNQNEVALIYWTNDFMIYVESSSGRYISKEPVELFTMPEEKESYTFEDITEVSLNQITNTTYKVAKNKDEKEIDITKVIDIINTDYYKEKGSMSLGYEFIISNIYLNINDNRIKISWLKDKKIMINTLFGDYLSKEPVEFFDITNKGNLSFIDTEVTSDTTENFDLLFEIFDDLIWTNQKVDGKLDLVVKAQRTCINNPDKLIPTYLEYTQEFAYYIDYNTGTVRLDIINISTDKYAMSATLSKEALEEVKKIVFNYPNKFCEQFDKAVKDILQNENFDKLIKDEIIRLNNIIQNNIYPDDFDTYKLIDQMEYFTTENSNLSEKDKTDFKNLVLIMKELDINEISDLKKLFANEISLNEIYPEIKDITKEDILCIYKVVSYIGVAPGTPDNYYKLEQDNFELFIDALNTSKVTKLTSKPEICGGGFVVYNLKLKDNNKITIICENNVIEYNGAYYSINLNIDNIFTSMDRIDDELNNQICNDYLLLYETKPHYEAYVICYYGTYNGTSIVFMDTNFLVYLSVITSETVGEYTFIYGSSNQIKAYNNGKFYSLTEAYLLGLITDADIALIYEKDYNTNPYLYYDK